MINLSPVLLIGKQYSEEVMKLFDGFKIRVMRVGNMYDAKYDPNRWNVVVNKDNEIVDVYKG